MPKHRFERTISDAGNIVIRMCPECGKITELDKNGNIPAELQNEECEPEELFSEAAARIMREATKG